MINKWPVGSLFGFTAVAVYLVLAAVAYFLYPESYSPLGNYLSDLGNPLANPDGAFFYNLGGSLLGALLIPFYLGMRAWNTGEKISSILVITAIAAGMASSAFLIFSCIFPVGTHTSLHGIFATAAFGTSILFWVASAFALLRNPRAIKWIAFFGYLPIFGNIVLAFLPEGRNLSEWVSVLMFLVYVVLLAFNTRVINQPRPLSGRLR